MGDKVLEPKTTKAQGIDDHYKIISFKGQNLPGNYLNLIRAPFLNTLRCGNDLFKLIDKDAFYLAYGKYIDHLLKKEKSLVRLATLSDETILGWCLIEGTTLHYVWVKKEVRRQGIGKSLVPQNTEIFTHITNYGLSIWPKDNYKKMRFNPFV